MSFRRSKALFGLSVVKNRPKSKKNHETPAFCTGHWHACCFKHSETVEAEADAATCCLLKPKLESGLPRVSLVPPPPPLNAP